MKNIHVWRTQRQGGSPDMAESCELVTYCQACGVEQTDDNRDDPCPDADIPADKDPLVL